MDIGVVIPTRDPDRELLLTAVESAMRQGPAAILVVDDGSVEEVVLPGVEVLRTNGLGISGARNVGIERLRTTFVHVLDHDDLVRPGFYDAMSGLAIDSDVAFSECAFIRGDGTATGTFLTGYQPPTSRMLPELYKRNPIASSAAVFRRSLWERGRFRPYRFVQDWDFWLSAARRGGRFAFDGRPLACHRLHATQTTASAAPSTRLMEHFRMLARHPSRHQPAALARIAVHAHRARRAGL